MRDYGKISPQFWIGSTGKTLRASGPEAMIVAMYLITNPQANMLGLYYLPLISIAHETGLGMEGALKGLARACEGGFCAYDEQTEVVWVYEMARFQIADQLKPEDNRVKGIQNEYTLLPSNPFLPSFFEKYKGAFHLTNKRDFVHKKTSPYEAPCKPLRSQEQEQEQEQDIFKYPNGYSSPPPKADADQNEQLIDEESEPPIPTDESGVSAPPVCPFTELVDIYHELLPELPRVKSHTAARQSSARGRWRETWVMLRKEGKPHDKMALLAYFKRFFVYASQSDFLMGRAKDWQADFEWLLKSANFAKVIEARYHGKGEAA